LLSRTFAPDSKSSIYGTFAHGSENVLELSFSGTKMTWHFSSQSEMQAHMSQNLA